MGRPKKNINGELTISKQLRAIGATGAMQKGNQIELTLDPRNLSSSQKKRIAGGLLQANSSLSHSFQNDPMDASFFDGPYSANETMDVHQKIRLAMRYFRSEPLVGKIIEFMAVFSNDGFKNECSDPKIKKFYDDWIYNVNFELVLTWIFLEYYRSGNVVTVRELMQYNKELNNPSPEYLTSEAGIVTGSNGKKLKRVQIPGAYTVINPLHVFVRENNAYQDSLYFDMDQVKSSDLNTADETDLVGLSIKNLPAFLKLRHQGSKQIPLPKKNIKRILRMRQPYEPYGSVLMERAFAPIHEKNKLRMMDMTMVNSVINQIIKVTIGNDDYPATPKQLQRLAKAFQNAGKSQTIFWNHTLNIEVIRPDTKVLNKEKFERVNEDIRNAFGISEVLTGGGGSKTNFATAFLSLKAFLTNLKLGREDVLRWVRQEYEDIADVMGFDKIPEPMFNPLSLTDEIAEKQIILQLIDRGVISYETAQSRLGYDPQIELDRKENEKPLIEEGILGIGAAGSPYQQAAIDTKEEVVANNKKQGKQRPKTEDNIVNDQNRAHDKTGNPNASPDPDKKELKETKKRLAEGRPKGQKGNYPKNRKPNVKGTSASQLKEEKE